MKKDHLTIISNNCIAVPLYKNLNTKYYSPTIGLEFFCWDFVKLCANYRNYLTHDLKFPNISTFSNYPLYQYFYNHNKPIGALDDIAVFFRHFESKDHALKKWNERVKRVNYSNLIFVFAEDSSCDKTVIEKFLQLPYPRKICLTFNDYSIDNVMYRPDLRTENNLGWDIENYEKFKSIIISN